jgi:hypothetical protein
MAIGYGRAQVATFANSLRQSGFKGRLVLFVGNQTLAARRELESLADLVLDAASFLEPPETAFIARNTAFILGRLKGSGRFNSFYPKLFSLAVKSRKKSRRFRTWYTLEAQLEGWISLRHFVYASYLEKTPADYVLLSDVRDVYFQRDPFEHPPRSEFEVYLEAAHMTIDACQYNRQWLRDLAGADAAVQFAAKPISCAGTVLGTLGGVRRYLGLMTRHILAAERPMGPSDQGMHNYLLWTGGLDPVTIGANGHSTIYTAGNEKTVDLNGDHNVINFDGAVPAVVHQYDRHRALASLVAQRFERASEPLVAQS